MEDRMHYRESIREYAFQQIGITESPAGSNKVKYNDWYYPDFIDKEEKIPHKYRTHPEEFPWCGTFCSMSYKEGGFGMPPIDTELGVHYVPTLYYKAKAMKWNTLEPKMTDLVIFDFKANNTTDIQHIGLFDCWIEKGISFYSIEGNTSADEKGSQSNGGAVCRKKRSMANVIQFVNLIDNIK